MSSRCLACCLVGLLGASGSTAAEPLPNAPKTAQQKDEPADSLADQVAAIKKEYKEQEQKFYDDLRAAKNDEKKIRELNQQYLAVQFKPAYKLTALIKAHPQEKDAFEGILVLVGEMRYSHDSELVTLVRKHHMDNPKMGQLCFHYMYRREEWVEGLLQDTATKHSQQAARGQAEYALGMYYRHLAQPWGKKLAEEEETKLLEEATRHFTAVTKNYASIATPDGKAKLGEKAASQLTRVKNLASLKVGKMAPEIEGKDMDGKAFKLSDYRGKVVL